MARAPSPRIRRDHVISARTALLLAWSPLSWWRNIINAPADCVLLHSFARTGCHAYVRSVAQQ
eukprot:9339099-Alexandrium_andersonii.AAC.1